MSERGGRWRAAVAAAGRWLSMAFSVLALLVLAGWALGQAASDRWLWSQYVYWTPTVVVLGGAAVLVVLAWLASPPALRRRSPRRGQREGRPRRLVRRLRWVATGGVALLGLWLATGELRLHRAVLPPADAPGLPLRVVYWNSATSELPYPPTLLSEHQPDLAVVAGPRWKMGRDMFFKAVSDERLGPAHVLWRGHFAIASRYAILDSGFTILGLNGERSGMVIEQHGSAAVDHGQALYLVLDTTAEIGRPLVVWVLDLPSDPTLPRAEMMARARRVLEGWPRGEGEGFPPSDVAVGDLNTPRGSWSLSRLLPGLVHAWADAGWGELGSFPRERPLWHIDHLYLRRPLKAESYQLVDPGEGRHFMQVAELRVPGEAGER